MNRDRSEMEDDLRAGLADIAPPLLLLGLGLLPAIPTAPAIAQSCQEPMGQAITGAPVQLDACSFNRVNLNSVNFTDYLGSQKINAQAHCPSRTWTTFHDQVTHQPQSTATANMLARICNSGELVSNSHFKESAAIGRDFQF